LKTKANPTKPASDIDKDIQENPLAPLLERTTKSPSGSQAREKALSHVNGLLLGTLQHMDEQGMPCVQIDSLGKKAVQARSLTPLTAQDLGRQLVLGFENGEADCPIILGLMHETAQAQTQITSRQPLHIEQNGVRTIIEATEELELRCGNAVILLQADGRIQLRGEYITSHASAGQRIRGGSVQIN
jgi:hypothetical protein